MSLDLLDTPVRLTWDFPSAGVDDPARTRSIAECIRDAGVFFVSLQGSPLRSSDIPEVLTILSGSHCSVACHADDRDSQYLSRIKGFNVQLLLDLTSIVTNEKPFDQALLSGALQEIRENGFEPVISITPLRRNLAQLPDLMSFCTQHDVTKIKLPNAHIGDSFHGYSPDDLPRWQDLNEFNRLWASVAGKKTRLPAMEIHDLFLWEIMTPGQEQNRSEYGGCQAGNSLAHVDTEGVVHPCSAWPCPLGILPKQSLTDIWSGKERHAVCEKIAVTPDGCKGCRDLNICFGGCRGLSKKLNRTAGERDLMCSGPR